MIADDLYAERARLRADGSAYCLATVVRVEAPTSAKPGDKAIITPEGKLVGWIGGSCAEASVRREAQRVLANGTPQLVRIQPELNSALAARPGEVVLPTSCPSGGTLEIFLEPQLARPQLVVIGRSPVAKLLIRLATLVGFRTCAVHPGATAEDFPGADQVLSSLELSAAHIGADSWVVVATMGHYDEEALEAALGTKAAYVQVISTSVGLAASLPSKPWPYTSMSPDLIVTGLILAGSTTRV
jgi:xanthine dehydrogenase accessory factor